MGGKTKQSQRTKNNARPSSSGRSALLLSNAKLETGVMNINGTELPALFPTLVAPNIDPLVSPELQLCIKKLNKKDPITKSKALQELSELVSNSKVDDVVAVLPSWAHFYKILTADPDRKVREATQWCHGSIVSACGRRLAPHLKQLMPAWLQAQYDEHAPAQAHAQHSLAKTFPDSKLPEVISFCKSEVLAHLVDNLIGNGEAAFVKKSDSPEERELQAARVVASSLRGLQYVAAQLPAAHDDWLWAELGPLLRAAAFWKRAAHTDSKIRAAWYGAVGALARRFGATFAAAHGARALRTFAAAAERAPLAAAHLWDSLLLFIYSVPDWHKYLDNKDLLVKRILDVLESGGWGDARHLGTVLLPLLARLPPSLLDKELYTRFFDALFNGLDKKAVLSSKSERQAWITSLAECLRYLSTQPHEYVPELVSSVHRTWLEKVLAAEGRLRTDLIRHSAGSMADLVRYWLRRGDADLMIRNFWLNVGATLAAQARRLPADPASIAPVIEAHVLLLRALRTAPAHRTRHTVRFEGDPPASPPPAPALLERYERNLHGAVEDVCAQYFELARERQVSGPILAPLSTLVVEFECGRVLGAVARRLGCGSPYDLYERVLRAWLAGDTMRCRPLLRLVFLLLAHLVESEQDALLDTFKQFPPSVVEWCIQLSLSPPHRESAAVRRWLRGAAVAATARAACRRVIDHGDAAARDLLLLCCTTDEHGEWIISPEAVSDVMDQLSAALECGATPRAEAAARLAARLAAAAPPPPRLLLALFRLTLLVPLESAQVPAEAWREVRAAWQAGMRGRTPLRRAAAAALHHHLRLRSNLPENLPPSSITSNDEQNTENTLDMKKIEHVVSLCPYLLSSSTEQHVTEVVDFTRCMFDVAPSDARAAEAYAVRHAVVRGDISCPLGDGGGAGCPPADGDGAGCPLRDVTSWIINDHTQETIDELTNEGLVSHLNNCVFRSMYLRTILLHKVDEDSEDTWCNVLLVDDYFVTELCKVLHDYVVVGSLRDAYAFSPHYNLLNETTRRLDELVENIVAECTVGTRARVLNALTEAAALRGYFWPFTARRFGTLAGIYKRKNRENTENIKENTENIQENAETIQENTESSRENTENIQENAENSQENVESSTNKRECGQNKTEECEGQTDPESDIFGSFDFRNMKEIITGSGYFHTLQASEACSVRTRYLLMLRCYCAAHGGDAAFLRDVTDTQRGCGADVIVNAYYTRNHVMLYEMDVTSSPWSAVACNAAVCDYLAALVESRGWDLPAHHWDFATITLCNLLTSVRKSIRAWGSSKVSMLARSVLRLYLAVERFVSSARAACERRQPAAHVAHLPTEWADIFAPDLRSSLLHVILYVLESSSKTCVTSNHIAVLDVLIQSARRLPEGAGPAGAGGPARVAIEVLAAPTHHSYKYLAYELVHSLLKSMVLEDASLVASWSGAESPETPESPEREPPRLSLLQYDAAFCRLRDLVTTATAHVKVCEETCSLAEFSDVHALALGWFLLAELAAGQCRLARGDLHHHYIHTYRERKWCEPLLTTALRLLPGEVVERARAPAPAPAHPHHVRMFTTLLDRDVYQYCGGAAVGGAACGAVRACVCGAGAGDARGWRGAAPHRHATLLDNIVQAYITPTVVKEEFTMLQQRASELEDMEITIHWSTYEVSCTLSVEERGIELRVALSRSHPLGLARFVAPDHAPASNTNWLVMYMAYQNGSVVNALKMWAGAVNSKVERAPQCYICYCRLHFSTGRLPAVLCHQCRNRFHTACLRKWFATSNKSNCPLCRTSF